MSLRTINGHQGLLRIFIDEEVKSEHKYLWHLVLERARKQHLAGCTITKGAYGFGPHHGFHSEFNYDGAGEFTMIVEIVETEERLDQFLKDIENLLIDAFVVREKVFVRHYSHEQKSEEKIMETKENAQLSGKQTLLRFFVGESDRAGIHPLYLEILTQAKKTGLAGATVIKGVSGFGASSVIHERHFLKMSSDTPVILEIVDSKDKIHKFMNSIEPLLKGALVTEEEVEVRHYKAK